MRRQRGYVDLYVDENDPTVLIIKPKNKMDFMNNSVYEFKLPEIPLVNQTKLPAQSITYITEPAPCYATLQEVLSLAGGLDLDDKNVLFHIREASRTADYWVKKSNSKVGPSDHIVLDKDTIREEYYPMYMFVKHKALYECIKEYYIEAVTHPYEIKDQVSDLSREEKFDLKAIKALLDQAKKDFEEWLELVVTITADPKWALRGKWSIPISTPNNKYYGLYHKTHLNGFNRGY